ncbi:hypothetical protein ScPMuIL_013344 [Solemya velum]
MEDDGNKITTRLSHFTCSLCLLIIFLASGFTQSSPQYVWKGGMWNECKHYTCGKGGKQMRTVWCERSNGLATQEKNCLHLTKPRETRNCFKVCEEHKDKVRWSASTWSKCSLVSGEKKCSRGKGVQNRTVLCVWKDTGFTENDDVCSKFKLKPISEQACELRCPQDCIVSEYSKWNGCDNCKSVNRTRTRRIVVPPLYGGRSCPDFTDMEPCSNCSQIYSLSVSSWSQCSPFHAKIGTAKNMHPLIGQQSREIMCQMSTGTIVNWKFCLDREDLTPDLARNQACIIPQNCELSPWSTWRPINSSCVTRQGNVIPGFLRRQRHVVKIPLGTGQPCDRLEEIIEVQGSAVKNCPVYRWSVVGWTRCEQAPGVQQCSVGIQHGRAVCIEKNHEGHEKPVSDAFCEGDRPLTSRMCTVACDWDCTVSRWSEWSECWVKDCEQYMRRRRNNEGTGQRFRTREVLTAPGRGGEKCPHLSETQSCDPEPCFKWTIGVGPCMLLNSNVGDVCGLGIAYRTIGCENKYGQRVSDSLCEELKKRPDDKEQCRISCPSDCVLSPWGAWSDCPDLCQEGRPQAKIRSRKRQIIAYSGTDGLPCPPNRNLEEVQECPTVIECAIYVWQTDQWGSCELEELSKPCGAGIQRREIGCYNLKGQLVSDERCHINLQPEKTQGCDLPCPQNCVLMESTDWSSCSASCWEATQVVPIQTRERYVLQYDANGGSPCPEQLVEVRQCLELPLCQAFYWETTDWTDCILALQIRQCGQGLRARNVTCRSDNGTLQAVDLCIQYVGPMPLLSEACYVSCDHECLFTKWSPWSLCVGGCQGHQFRTRRLIDENSAHFRCRDHRTYPLDERRPCLCTELHPVVIGEWSDCIVERESGGGFLLAKDERVDNSCGPGKRYKVITCRNNRNAIQSASRCTVAEYDEEKCMMECPTDCSMSHWTDWSQCSVSCGTGVQMRYRHVRQHPHNGGRQCPQLDTTGKETQTKLCWEDCELMQWHSFDWSVCMLIQDGCGQGTQTRTVRCEAVDLMGYRSRVVDDFQCADEPPPSRSQPCHMACEGECVVSHWSEWTACDQSCSMDQVQERRRVVLREPKSYSTFGTRCPPLLEERVCVKGDNCMEYNWSLSDWTSCLVNSGLNECGIGHKERHAICRNHLRDIMDNEVCEKRLGPVSDPLVIACDVPCDADCLLSDWTPWQTCSRTCGLGVMLRDRTVLQEPMGNGRSCPQSLSQSKPCFLSGCYKWSITDWSPCTIQKSACGHGVQQRNLTCISEDGLPVNPAQCFPTFNNIIMSTERECQIPCPGECVISDWSPWNECFVSCQDFHLGHVRGIQSRSRAILAHASPLQTIQCPSQLWESRPCQASQCYTFQWEVSPWKGLRRQIWCKRSDGLRVSNGCEGIARPPSILSCFPPCPTYSNCNDTNSCKCFEEYYSEYDSNLNLISCSMDNSSFSTLEPKTAVLPETGKHSFWMYAVVAVGTIFVIFVAVALYNMSELFRSGPRPRTAKSQATDSVASKAFECPHKTDSLIGEKCMKCNLSTGNLDLHKRLPHGVHSLDACQVTNEGMFMKHLKKNRLIHASIFPGKLPKYLPEHECLLYSESPRKTSNSTKSLKFKPHASDSFKLRHSDTCLHYKPSSSIVRSNSDSAVSVWTRSTENSKVASKNSSYPDVSDPWVHHTRQPSCCSSISSNSHVLNKTMLSALPDADRESDLMPLSNDGSKSLENFMHNYLNKLNNLSSPTPVSEFVAVHGDTYSHVTDNNKKTPGANDMHVTGNSPEIPIYSSACVSVFPPADLGMLDERSQSQLPLREKNSNNVKNSLDRENSRNNEIYACINRKNAIDKTLCASDHDGRVAHELSEGGQENCDKRHDTSDKCENVSKPMSQSSSSSDFIESDNHCNTFDIENLSEIENDTGSDSLDFIETPSDGGHSQTFAEHEPKSFETGANIVLENNNTETSNKNQVLASGSMSQQEEITLPSLEISNSVPLSSVAYDDSNTNRS